MIVLVIYVVSDVVYCNCVMSSYLQGNEILHLIFSTIKKQYVRVGQLSKHDNTMIFDFDYLLFIS